MPARLGVSFVCKASSRPRHWLGLDPISQPVPTGRFLNIGSKTAGYPKTPKEMRSSQDPRVGPADFGEA